MAIDSCRRTSNPYVNFMEIWKGMKWEVSLLHDSFQRCLSFMLFCKSHLSFTSISFEVQWIYNRNVVKKKTNFIFHQIWTWNIAKWRFMLLSELWDWSVLSYFHFFSSFGDYLCMYWVVILSSRGESAVCSLSCTLIKDVDFVSGRPGFQIPTPTFLGLMFVWTKKKLTKQNKKNL